MAQQNSKPRLIESKNKIINSTFLIFHDTLEVKRQHQKKCPVGIIFFENWLKYFWHGSCFTI